MWGKDDIMQLKIGEKNYNIKFAYKPTLKARVLSKTAKAQAKLNTITDEELGGLEDLLLFIPEMLLVGLQNNHSDEFGYNIDTEEGKEEQLDKAFNIMDDFIDEGGDVRQLFEDLQEEMVTNGFLAKMFQEEQEKLKEQENNETPKIAEVPNLEPDVPRMIHVEN